MTAYIAGPVTGKPNLNRPAFARAENLLRSWGHEPVSPFDVSPYSPDKTWLDYMLDDIPAMLRCEVVVALPGWIWSRGARIEVILTLAIGRKVIWFRGLEKERLAA